MRMYSKRRRLQTLGDGREGIGKKGERGRPTERDGQTTIIHVQYIYMTKRLRNIFREL